MGNRHVKPREKKIIAEDMNTLYDWSVSRLLRTGDLHEIELTRRIERNLMKTILRFTAKNKCGYLKVCDIEYPSNKQERTKHFKRSTEIIDRLTYTVLQQMRITNADKVKQ